MGVNGIYGLSGSGLDVESMVKAGMLGKKNEYEKMQQRYTQNEWKKSELLELYGELQTFSTSTLTQYKMSSNMNARGATSSNPASVGATANADAALMTHYVNVESLASNVYLIGTKMERENDTDASSKNQLSSILFDSIQKDTSGKIVVTKNNDTKKYNEYDTAILFSIDDGITGAFTNSNEAAVTVTANVDSTATGTYKLNITSTAEVATIDKNIPGVNSSTSLMDMLQKWTGMSSDTIIGYFYPFATDSQTAAVAFTIGDGTNSKEVSYTYQEIYDYISGTSKTMKTFIDDLNSELKIANVNVAASISDDGTLSLKNTGNAGGLNSKIIISIDTSKINDATAARNNYETGISNAYAEAYIGTSDSTLSFASDTFVSKYSSQKIADYGGINSETISLAYTSAYNAYSSTYVAYIANPSAYSEYSSASEAAKASATSVATSTYNRSYSGSSWIAEASQDVATDIENAYNSVVYVINHAYANPPSIPDDASEDVKAVYNSITDTATTEAQAAANSYALNNTSTLYADNTKFDSIASNLVDGLLKLTNSPTIAVNDSDSGDTRTITIFGEDATGTIIDGTGKERNLYFTENTVTYGGMTITAHEVASNIKISNPGTETIAITYGELLHGYSLNDLASKINSKANNVQATYDSVQDRFSIYNKESGSKNQINIALTGNDEQNAATNTKTLFDAFGLKQTNNGELYSDYVTFNLGETTQLKGVEGEAYIDGVQYTLDSNNLTVNGVTYNFLNKTDGNVTVGVTQDKESIVEKVKSFVSDYNALLAKLYEWYDEKPNSEYKPLTASQKESMKQEQIEKWEDKAKAGLLYHDSTLNKIITDLRAIISENVEGISEKYNNVFSVGISTTGVKGQLVLDEDKLNAALAEDPNAVYNIFAKLDGGETQYLVAKKEEPFWTTNVQSEHIYVLDEDGEIQTQKDSEGNTQYLVTKLGQSFWTTEIKAGYEYVLDSDGNRRTKTIERTNYNGIAQRLGDIFSNSMKSVRTIAGTNEDISEDSDLNNLLRDLQTKMSNFRRMMNAFEDQLYKKYDKMESALALLGAQLNYVAGQFQ